MILGIWVKVTLQVIGRISIGQEYDLHEDEPYRKNVVKEELKKFGYDWEFMDYAVFSSEESLQNHIKRLHEEKLATFAEIQAKLKGTKTSV